MITRRTFISTTGLCAAAAQTPRKRPNIVILFSDDQRHDTIRGLGNTEIQTPNLDNLCRQGTAFSHAFIMGGTSGAVCIPSRAMLLSGQTLFHAHNAIMAPGANPRPFTMFPEYFQKAGYETYGIGKWHNGERLYARCFSGGENIFFGGMSDHDKVPVADFDPSGQYPKAKRRMAEGFSSELFSDSAVKFLKEYRSENPFLLYVAYTSPHDPRTPPREYADMYPPEKMALPKNFLPEHPFDNGDLKLRDEQLAPWPRTPEVVRQHIAAYYGMITHLDAQVGRVLAALKDSGHAEDTIVVFAGDNGLAVGQHGLLGKQSIYEHSVRVPLIIRAPGLPRGRVSQSFCYLLDVFPTLCELTGLPVPETVEGRSVAAALRNPKTQLRDSMFFAYRQFQRGVRTDRWKLALYNAGGQRTTQLFDLRTDPWETRNLAGETAQAARVRELTALLRAWMKKTDDPLDLDKPDWGYLPPASQAAAPHSLAGHAEC